MGERSKIVLLDQTQESETLAAKAGTNPRFKPAFVSRPTPTIETASARLEDGSIIEIIENPNDPSESLFAVFKDGRVEHAREYICGDRVLVPIPRDQLLLRHVRLSTGASAYESVDSLRLRIEAVLSRCLDLDSDHVFLLACFVLSTWSIEQLPVAPYIALVGLPRSGKSTVLRVLRLLCRRSLLTADITSAAFYRVCDRIAPTLLVDETTTAGDRKSLFHLLRTGTTRDVVALRKDQSFNSYGPKVVSWAELPDDAALNSRCIVIPMLETKAHDLARSTNQEIIQAADELQKQLLMYRFEKYNSLVLPSIPGVERLKSRSRDLYEALALACDEDIAACQRLLKLLRVQQQFNREPLSPAVGAVLQTIYRSIHEPTDTHGVYPIIGITASVNADLAATGERFRLSPRAVGAALYTLGITSRKRTNTGWMFWLDRKSQKRIHDMVALYGLDNESCLPPEPVCEVCEFCKDIVDMRKYRVDPSVQPSSPLEY